MAVLYGLTTLRRRRPPQCPRVRVPQAERQGLRRVLHLRQTQPIAVLVWRGRGHPMPAPAQRASLVPGHSPALATRIPLAAVASSFERGWASHRASIRQLSVLIPRTGRYSLSGASPVCPAAASRSLSAPGYRLQRVSKADFCEKKVPR